MTNLVLASTKLPFGFLQDNLGLNPPYLVKIEMYSKYSEIKRFVPSNTG